MPPVADGATRAGGHMLSGNSTPRGAAQEKRVPGSRLGQVFTGDGGRLVTAVILLAVFEGAIRKWVVPGSSDLRYAAYASKDIVFILGALVVARLASGTHRRYATLLAVASLLILPGILFNLDATEPVGAFLSLRAYVLLPIGAFLVAGSIRSFKRVNQIALLIGAVTIAEVALGAVQFRLATTHWLNRYDSASAAVGAEFGHVRATGTFSYITGMSVIAGLGAWAGIYLFLSGGAAKRMVGVIIMIASLLCGVLSMSRTGIFLALLTIGCAVMFFRRGKELVLVGSLALAIYVLLGSDAPDQQGQGAAYAVAMKRFERADSLGHRISYFFNDVARAFEAYPMGSGLGDCQRGAFAIAHPVVANFNVIENEPGKILTEVGVLGLLGVYLIRLAPIFLMLPRWKRCQSPQALALYAASIPFLLISAATNVAFNHTLSTVYWCVVALVFALENMPDPSGTQSPATVVVRRNFLPRLASGLALGARPRARAGYRQS